MIAIGPAFDMTRPWALWGLALAAPIVLLHLYFRRRTRRIVPFLPLFRESLIQTKDLRRWRRLRDLMTLMARLGALVCFVLALSGLRPAETRQDPRALAIVVDADVTTRATEADGRSRFAHAIERARAWVRAQRVVAGQDQLEAPILVVLAHVPARIVVGPTRDGQRAVRDLSRLSGEVPARRSTSLEAAESLASAWLATQANGTLVVLTSRSVLAVGDVPSRIVEGIGVAQHDAGIDGMRWRRDHESWRDQLNLRLYYDGSEAATIRVGAYMGEKTLAKEAVHVKPGEAPNVALTFEPPSRAAWIDVRIALENDCFAEGNEASYYSPAPQRPSLLLVQRGRPRWFVAAARDALVEGKEIDLVSSGSVSPENFARAKPRTVALVDGVPLPDEALRPGAYIFLAPFSGALPFDVGTDVHAPLVWRTEADHPLMIGLDFTRTFAAKATAIHGQGLRPLAFAEGVPVIAEGERDGVRYAALGIHPEASLLPIRTALPLWIRKAVERLGVMDRAPFRPFYKTGDVVRPEVELGFQHARIEAHTKPRPSAASLETLDARGRMAWSVPPGVHGRFRVRTTEQSREFPFGVLDVDPDRTVVPARVETALPPPAAPAPASRARLWRRMLLGAGLLLLVLDLLLTLSGLRREHQLRTRVASA